MKNVIEYKDCLNKVPTEEEQYVKIVTMSNDHP